MTNIYLWLTLLITTTLSLIPPINFIIKNPENPYWLWMIMVSGAAGIFTIFIKTNLCVRLIAIGGFINCFLSSIPYISFTSYVSLILCCYLYIMASRIKRWTMIFKALQAVVILDLLIFLMQAIHHDPLLNFGIKDVEHFGTLGQHMQMGSFGVIITAILINFSKINLFIGLIFAIFCKSSWSFVCVGIGFFVILLNRDIKSACCILVVIVSILFVWAIHEHKTDSISGRLPVWQKSIEIINKHPWKGYGIGTFKVLFTPLSRMRYSVWKEAHNFIIQLAFEIGYPATGAILFGLGCLIWVLFQRNQWGLLSGLSMIMTDALVHFPDRMMQTVPMIVIFLAYCSVCLKKDKLCRIPSSHN